jgi:hypothetical protein
MIVKECSCFFTIYHGLRRPEKLSTNLD